MKKLSVDVYEDRSRPEGGHAVIRLNGLESLPDSVTFRIRPVDSTGAGDGAWQNTERHPLVTRLTKDGVELVVGPDIVESPLFLPGTLTAIEIQKCGVRGEFLWPRISPLVRPKRRHLIGAKTPREAKPDASEVIAFEEAHDASSELIPMSHALNGAASRSTNGAAPASVSADTLLEIKPDSIVLPSAAERAAATAVPPPAPSIAPPIATVDPAPDVPSAKSDIVWTDLAKDRGFSRWLLLAAVLGGVGLLAGLLLTLFGIQGKHRVAPADPSGGDASIAALLSVGTTSPRGQKTRDHTQLQLIERADALLHAPDGKRDRGEAAFMLKRYLATTLAEERTLWAITQLGSAYAEPDGARAPDYARARQLWDLAAALGDPVAMCFLAALHEHGLGAKASKPTALQWYLRAKDAGGCSGVDEAIVRVRR